ncbi:MAG: PatB family C-S lyase [Bacteroides sp.]|nr:PatB family C-S lyase [Bacteroides sp.]
MKYNFDEIIDRRGTDSLKVEGLRLRWNNENLIPMWVADMDFKTPPCVLEAARNICDQEILGYTIIPDSYYTSISNWLKKRYNWQVNPEMIQFTPGVVSGLSFIVQAFTRPGDKVLVQPPVYHPFFIYPRKNDREIVFNPLILENGSYRMDMELFRKQVKDCKLFFLCNPHNPGGRVWNWEELEEIAAICYENKVLVVADEIHADLTLPGHTHYPFSTISEKAKMNSITLMAASKAFNMPGLTSSHAISENPEILNRFSVELEKTESENGHIFAFKTVEAAYTYGEEWLEQLLAYIQENVNYLDKFLKEQAPKIKAILPEASYLVFLDCREMGLSHEQLVNFFVNKCGLALNEGTTFGKEGEGFMRMNIGCPRPTLEKALQQLKLAYDKQMSDK